MTQNDKPDLFVVDGSNIATEGRSQPSLEQLNEAVDAFRSEYPKVKVTVVVDATFGHRIAKKEVKAFDKAVSANELVTPPAGAVGRGDAFILAIADKAKAGVFSNDSFQEFHGDYEWLFDTGRLIGAKPVPNVGWVFVDRNPVRGRKSRESIKAAKDGDRADSSPTDDKERAKRRVRKKQAATSGPTPVEEPDTTAQPESDATAKPDPDTSPPEADAGRGRRSSRSQRGRRSGRSQQATDDSAQAAAPAKSKGNQINDPVAFFDFVEHHPVGAWVSGKVDTYASHGAYARVGDVLVYIPLRLMADPAPTSARKVLKQGDEIELVIVAYVPDRLSIDAALSSMAPRSGADGDKSEMGGSEQATGVEPAGERPRKKRPARRRSTKRAASTTDTPVEETPVKRSAAKKKAAKKAPAKKQAAARKAPAKKKAAAKRAPAKKKAAAKKAAAKKKAAAGRAGQGPSDS